MMNTLVITRRWWRSTCTRRRNISGGGEITAVCWVRSGDDAEDVKENVAGGATRGRGHEFGDAILAVGDENGVISVISAVSYTHLTLPTILLV